MIINFMSYFFGLFLQMKYYSKLQDLYDNGYQIID